MLEYLGVDIGDEKEETWFKRFDKDKSGFIDYEEFKELWLRVVDVRKELEDRGITCHKYTSKRRMRKLLRQAIDEEEAVERKTMLQAQVWTVVLT